MATGAHFFQSGVVGVIVGDGDFDAVFFFEFLDDFGARVIAPVIDVEHAFRLGGASKGEQGGACEHGFQSQFHGVSSVWVFQFFFRLIRKNIVTNRTEMPRNIVDIALISGVTERRSWPSI